MNGAPVPTDALFDHLCRLTEEALSQAKVEHIDAVNGTLRLRERVLARLWGFDTSDGLPAFSRELARSRSNPFARFDEDRVRELHELDRQLARVLEHNLGKLRRERKQLNEGRKYLDDVRSLYRGQTKTKYFEATG
ncbi:MAG: hypothetical protein MAG453_01232 [Calditrichaeota bacterium]|nr:hypothetical protein [Calditrichota bacterium]